MQLPTHTDLFYLELLLSCSPFQDGDVQFHLLPFGFRVACLSSAVSSLGSFGDPLCKKKCVSSGGRGQVRYMGPWEGLSVPCTDLPLSPSLPESLLLQYSMLPVHGSFWGSEGKLTCFSWWPLDSRWGLLLLLHGVGYPHPICPCGFTPWSSLCCHWIRGAMLSSCQETLSSWLTTAQPF